MNNRATVLTLFVLVIFAMATSGHGQQDPALKSRQFMHRKLEHAHLVLEGIVLEDFNRIEKNARMLSLLSQAAEWQILPSAEYKKHSEEFRRTTEALAESARKQNLDGAALNYVQLTLNCVECHKHVRAFHPEKPKKPDVPLQDGK